MKQAMNWIYIAMTVSAIGFIVYANYTSSNRYKKKVDTTEKPISQPVDMVMDSVDMRCGSEYHGREGASEYGEYDSN